MNDEQIKQRIAYLVEHGGIYDDPIAALQKQVRWLYVLIGAALAFHVVETIVYFA